MRLSASVTSVLVRCGFHPWCRRTVLALLVAAGGLALARPAAAQMSSNTIFDAQGNVLFEVPDTGGLLAPGTFGSATIPSEGVGTRFMWYPGKAAVRAGRVGFGLSEGGEWDDQNVGAYSAAVGVNTQAGGRGAVAVGQGTTAQGNQAVAGGYRTTASGLRSAAFGDLTTARGNFSTALGIHTTAEPTASVALGRWNVIRGDATSWQMSDPLLVAGNGSGPSNRSNAMTLRKNGDLTISGSLTEHSDRRLKTDVEDLGTVSNALDALQPVRFRYEEGTGHPTGEQIGLIAQDVAAEFPSLVREGPDGLLSLAYPKVTAVLVKGLQEQRDRIDALKQRVNRLEKVEARQADLAQEVAQLKERRGAAASVLGEMNVGLTGLFLVFVGGVIGMAVGRRWN